MSRIQSNWLRVRPLDLRLLASPPPYPGRHPGGQDVVVFGKMRSPWTVDCTTLDETQHPITSLPCSAKRILCMLIPGFLLEPVRSC